jgi:hypothetical protein
LHTIPDDLSNILNYQIHQIDRPSLNENIILIIGFPIEFGVGGILKDVGVYVPCWQCVYVAPKLPLACMARRMETRNLNPLKWRSYSQFGEIRFGGFAILPKYY